MNIDLFAICKLETEVNGYTKTQDVCFKCAVKEVSMYSNKNVELEVVEIDEYYPKCDICGKFLW